MKRKIFILAAFIAIGAAAIAYYQFQKPVSSIADVEPYVEYSSTELFAYFSDNESMANQDLNGKVIQVYGNVVDVLSNSDSSTTVVLGSNHPIFGVKCRFEPGSIEKVSSLRNKDVKIKGICTGMTADVEMNQCIYLNN